MHFHTYLPPKDRLQKNRDRAICLAIAISVISRNREQGAHKQLILTSDFSKVPSLLTPYSSLLLYVSVAMIQEVENVVAQFVVTGIFDDTSALAGTGKGDF
ncbi:MAG: hypothetical protein N4J56_004653 [Chroococcidiopsis sp. SAG 2025]|nr:hypothetical protein [Chroococcidiopsis sp. SAG 2025]